MWIGTKKEIVSHAVIGLGKFIFLITGLDNVMNNNYAL